MWPFLKTIFTFQTHTKTLKKKEGEGLEPKPKGTEARRCGSPGRGSRKARGVIPPQGRDDELSGTTQGGGHEVLQMPRVQPPKKKLQGGGPIFALLQMRRNQSLRKKLHGKTEMFPVR